MHLDPVLHHPSRTGPTYDHAAAAAREPVYRQERFQMQPKRLPINLRANMRPRPRARSGSGVTTGLRMARVPVLVRDSNNKPIEAGDGLEGSRWGVSDPSWHAIEQQAHQSGALPGMGALGGSGKLVALGVAIGAAVWLVSRR
jgi:hypothetical protein